MTTWTAALDELERRLEAAEALVGPDMPADPAPVTPFIPPTVAGSPTAEEAERASALLRRGELAVCRIEDAAEVLSEELAHPRQAPRPSPAASMIDTRV